MSKRLIALAVAFCLAWTAAGAVLLWPDEDEASSRADPVTASVASGGERTSGDEISERDAVAAIVSNLPVAPGTGPYAVEVAAPPFPVQPHLKQPPAAGLLFDVDSGEVLWAREPAAERPIASLTKMLTALIVAERHRSRERVLVSAKAPGVEGSRIGVLKPGTKVPLGGLLLGLLLASGNDAAVALAEHDAGTVRAFVKRMNRRADELQLRCSRFAGPAGLQDTGNSSCAYDLAALARADLGNEWIASIMRRRSAEVPFPIKGGMLSLANNHYFARNGIAGVRGAEVTGVKTGLTNGAGRCYVTTARLGDRHLGVVLLDSADPLRQVPLLLRSGFEAPPG